MYSMFLHSASFAKNVLWKYAKQTESFILAFSLFKYYKSEPVKKTKGHFTSCDSPAEKPHTSSRCVNWSQLLERYK